MKVGENVSVEISSKNLFYSYRIARFKTKQDTFNEGKFVQSADYVDGTTKYYTDDAGVKTSTEVTGTAGKIYVDLETASKNIYIYDANTGEFANFVANVATSADIDSLFV